MNNLREGEPQISTEIVGDVIDVKFSKNNDYLNILFSTTYGKDLTLKVKFSDFKQWLGKNKDIASNAFRLFLKDFLNTAKQTSELTEIVDDAGNIMPSDDKPSNAGGRMVGSSNVGSGKINKALPRLSRSYVNNLGYQGSVIW